MKKSYCNVTLPANLERGDSLFRFLHMLRIQAHAFGHQIYDPITTHCEDRICGDFELIFFLEGKGHIRSDGKSYDCLPGDLILIPPFTRHTIYMAEGDNFWFHFDVQPYYFHEDFISLFTTEDSLRIRLTDFGELHALMKILEMEIAGRKPGCAIFYNTILLQLLTLVVRENTTNIGRLTDAKRHEGKFEKVTHGKQKIVDDCAGFIVENISKPIKVGDLSHHLHISESYTFKVFMDLLGQTPNQFIQFIKIKEAERLLKTENITLNELSDRVGFSSAFYLSNVFKKYYGLSPKNYIKNFMKS